MKKPKVKTPEPEPQPKPIIVYDLGLGGVNLVSDPLLMKDNELIRAQNAEPYRERGLTGIRKRPAWRPINSEATAAIQGIVSVELASAGSGDGLPVPTSSSGPIPLPDVGASCGLVFVAMNRSPSTTAWKYTTDCGATWHDLTTTVDSITVPTVLTQSLADPDLATSVSGGAATFSDVYLPASGTDTYSDYLAQGALSDHGDILAQSGWGPSSPPSYLKASAVAAKESHTLTASGITHNSHTAGATHTSINSVTVAFYAWQFDPSFGGGFGPPGNITCQAFCRQSGSDVDVGAAVVLDILDDSGGLNTSFSRAMTTNPITSAAWVASDLTSAEFGLRITANTDSGNPDVYLKYPLMRATVSWTGTL